MDRGVIAWSGGKDAAYALHTVREGAGIEVVGLLTTVDGERGRSTMHGVHRRLYERQAAALDLPLNLVALPPDPSNEEYEAVMAREFERYRERDLRRMVFADILLEDVRSYREDQLAGTGLAGHWPLWGRDTAALVGDFLDAGFRATVVAVDGGALDASYAGRDLDEAFLDGLPPSVDPCGEDGEFHTFVRDGPIFDAPVSVETAGTVTRTIDGTDFHYADLRLSDP